MKNQFKILGCSGSVGKGGYTTCFQINDDILIDAGSGLLDQDFEELKKINKIFLTHSHLDHILGIPLLADLVGNYREQPIEVYGSNDTIINVKKNIFNGVIWPDFSVIPTESKPYLKFSNINTEIPKAVDQFRITPFYVNHTVRCFGYKIESQNQAIIFSGDTGPSDNLIRMINETKNLAAVIIDVSFQDKRQNIADLSRHFTPQSLAKAVAAIEKKQTIYITHQKPGCEENILKEIKDHKIKQDIKILERGLVINL